MNRWTLISNFTQLRICFKVERPEGWKQGGRKENKKKTAERIKNSSVYMRREMYPRQWQRGTYNI